MLRPFAAAALSCLALQTAPVFAGEPIHAPTFAVRGLDGRTVRFTEFKGKPLVLDFWATWCAPCRATMPHLDTVQQRYRERGLVVLGVSVDDADADFVKRYATKLGVKFRLAIADEEVLESYGPIRSIPTTFFIDRRGVVTRRVVGYIDAETLDSYVTELVEK